MNNNTATIAILTEKGDETIISNIIEVDVRYKRQVLNILDRLDRAFIDYGAALEEQLKVSSLEQIVEVILDRHNVSQESRDLAKALSNYLYRYNVRESFEREMYNADIPYKISPAPVCMEVSRWP